MLTRRETLKKTGWLATLPLFPAAAYAANGGSARKALKVEQLPAKAVLPSVDLHLAMNAQALSLLKQIQSGTQTEASLASGATLMHHYAEQLHHMEIDGKVKAYAKGRIGKTPDAVSPALAAHTSALMAQHGVAATGGDMVSQLAPTQAEHDLAMQHLSRHGISPIYHIFGDLLEAGASWAPADGPQAVAAPAQAAKAWFETALWRPGAEGAGNGAEGGEAHLLRVQNSCPVTPPKPPSWCPGPAALGLAHTIFVGAGSVMAFAAGGAVADLDYLLFCSAIAAEAATVDTVTDGLGLLMTPFEVWACANSEAIVAAIQAAFAKFGGAGQAGLGALIGDVLYNYMTDWLKKRNCPV